MKVKVDTSVCVAAGQCVIEAPNVFDQQADDGMVILLQELPTPEDAAAARMAAEVCPSGAITIEE